MKILMYLGKAFKWIIDPKNRTLVMFLGMALFLVLFLSQCNRTKHFKGEVKAAEKKALVTHNNYLASQDSVETYVTKNNSLKGVISGYQITEKELNDIYNDLFTEHEELKNTKPKTIIETKIEYREKIVEVPVYVEMDSNGGKFTFNADTAFDELNSRKLSGIIPFKMKYFNTFDSTEIDISYNNLFGIPYPGLANFDLKQSMGLIVGLSNDEETGRPVIWAETKYPGITFSSIVGADILADEKDNKLIRSYRKVWGVGLNGGIGLDANLEKTFFLGIGLNYTPRFLQFGK